MIYLPEDNWASSHDLIQSGTNANYADFYFNLHTWKYTVVHIHSMGRRHDHSGDAREYVSFLFGPFLFHV